MSKAEDQREALEVERHQDVKRGLPAYTKQACAKPIGRTYCFRPAGHEGDCRPFYAR